MIVAFAAVGAIIARFYTIVLLPVFLSIGFFIYMFADMRNLFDAWVVSCLTVAAVLLTIAYGIFKTFQASRL